MTTMSQMLGLLPAAGLGVRAGLPYPKELQIIAGKTLISHAVDCCLEVGITHIVVVIRPDKEAIVEHILLDYGASVTFNIVYQPPPYGALISPIHAALPLLQDHLVALLMPDTIFSPNPLWRMREGQLPSGLHLSCFNAQAETWRQFGVIDPVNLRVHDKPDDYISRICWGVAMWDSRFSRCLLQYTDLTQAFNAHGFTYDLSIQEYKDFGVNPPRTIRAADDAGLGRSVQTLVD